MLLVVFMVGILEVLMMVIKNGIDFKVMFDIML